jgi:hypothetical protein
LKWAVGFIAKYTGWFLQRCFRTNVGYQSIAEFLAGICGFFNLGWLNCRSTQRFKGSEKVF